MKKNDNPDSSGRFFAECHSVFRKLLLLAVFSSFISVYASPGQNYLKRVSVDVENATVEEALRTLNDLSGKCITYKQEEVSRETKLITLHNNSITVLQAVGECLQGTGLSYSTSHGSILVVPARQTRQGARTITGKVTDTDGNPLPGATINVKDTQIGTTTSSAGTFVLNIPAQHIDVPLVCSYLGYTTREFDYGDSTDITLTMEEATSEISEVIVTGMFNKNRESYTGAVSVVTAEDIVNFGSRNLIQTLSNIDPSFQMVTDNFAGSNPNNVPNIQIRGAANLPGDIENLREQNRDNINVPLILLDGFEITLERMMDLNEHRIETIVLLKDAAASALYGSRAANGVVVITSKKPEAGKLTVSYNGTYSVEAPDLSGYNLLNAADKLELERQAGYYSNSRAIEQHEILVRLYNERYADVLRGVDTYWLSKPLRTAIPHSHSLYLDGGSEDFRYSAGLIYDRYNGVMKNSYRQNVAGNVMINYYHKNFSFSLDLNVGGVHSENSNYGAFSDYAKLNPYFREEDPQSGQIYRFFPDEGAYRFPSQPNPMYNASLGTKNYSTEDYWRATFNMDWKPTEHLTVVVRAGMEKANIGSHQFLPAAHTDFMNYQGADLLRKGSYTLGTGVQSNYNADATMSYSRVFNSKHSVFAGFNMSVKQDDYLSNSFTAEGFPDPNMDFISASLQYEKGGKPGGDETKTRSVGIIGNVNYSYDSRYFADLSLRYDGNSAFGARNRWGEVWSAGAGWNIHRESFFTINEVVNRLKLRGSYGTTGTQGFQPYDAIMTYRYITGNRYGYNNGAEVMRLGNENLKWQTTDKANIGIEVALFNNRFVGEFDLYREKTRDLISDVRLPSSNGFTSYKDNLGSIENRGWELKGTFNILRNIPKKLAWSVTFSMAHNKNTLLEISESLREMNEKIISESAGTDAASLAKAINPNFLYVEGQSMKTIYAVRSLGIDPATGNELFLDQNGNVTEEWNAYDQVACGVNEPKLTGNINTYFRYRNLIVSASFGYRLGGDIYNTTLRDRVETYSYEYNVDRRVYDDRWKQPGDQAKFKGIDNTETTKATSRFVQRENTFTFNTVSVKYDLSDMGWASKAGIGNLTVGFTTNDLFYLSSVKRERGINYPFARRFSLTLSAIF